MFSFFKKTGKRNRLEISSLCNATTFSIEEVSDVVFSSKMMGDGIAFNLDEEIIYAPCDGKIILVSDTKHAIGVKTKEGVEILIHIGLDTVNLNGKGFELLLDGIQVKRGEPILRFDRKFMEQKGVDLTTMLVFTELNGYSIIDRVYRDVKKDESVIRLD